MVVKEIFVEVWKVFCVALVAGRRLVEELTKQRMCADCTKILQFSGFFLIDD